MRYLIALLFILKISNSFAQTQVNDCYENLTLNHSASSRVFQLGSHEVEEFDVLNEEMAISVIDILLKKEINCSVNELLSQNPATCHRLRTGTTCEVLTKIGYFLIHRSAYGSFDHNIIWTRWD